MESLKMIVSAAAPLGKDTEETVRKRLNVDIKQAWGKGNIVMDTWGVKSKTIVDFCCLLQLQACRNYLLLQQ